MENIYEFILKSIKSLYSEDISNVEIQETRKEFEGDITILTFPLVKYSKKTPEQTAQEIGELLIQNKKKFIKYNVVKGFLNIVLNDSTYSNFLNENYNNENIGIKKIEPQKGIMIEFSSPNTNKPLHLGHIRNNLLGYSITKILEASGKKVYTTQIINDRGIHICKSMIAWIKFGNNKTPKTENMKGDKFVGEFYVKFDKEYKKQKQNLLSKGYSEEEAKKNSPIILEAQELLKKWENGDEKTIQLWKEMNSWVYEGFNKTYEKLGVHFNKNYYESETYILGKKIVDEGLIKNIFYKKADNSIWVDLEKEKLDQKLLLRSDGTSVYITQDLGTALERFKDFDIDRIIYTVGNEQDYHFKVLFSIFKKMEYTWAENMYHLSYGMVELPEGKMKSREGNVVDADDLIDEMINTAKTNSKELGKLDNYDLDEKEDIFRKIGLGALKYFILKVEPKKTIIFDPKESIDFNGNTGPFIQYTYARIFSILKKGNNINYSKNIEFKLSEKAKNIIKLSLKYQETIFASASEYNPSLIANYTYSLVKEYNSFYQNTNILNSASEEEKILGLKISKLTGNIIKSSMSLLGIEMPERM